MGGFWQRLRAALGRDKDAPQQAGSRNRPAGEPALPGGGRGRSGAAADREVQKLVQGLRHADPNVRAAAARKLGELGARAGPAAVPALVEALADEDDGVRSSAALSLGVFGVQAAAAVPALVKALGDPDDDVRSSAGIALEDIGPPARAALTEALSHPNSLVRTEAAIILRQLEAEGEDA